MQFRFYLRLTAAVALAGFGSMAAHGFDKIVVFGDSYNDVGNIYALAAGYGVVYPPPPYYDGRFSNGPIWIEHIANDWGLALSPSVLGGTDYATGGAQLLRSVVLEGLPIPSIKSQVTAYLAANGGKADPQALYVIEGGGNDILTATKTPPSELGTEIATALHGMERSLRLAGAKRFLIPELIDVGQLPGPAAAGPEAVAYANAASIAANEALLSKLAYDAALPGIEIYTIPVFRTFLAVANAKTHFGFTNVVSPCLSNAGECADPDHTLWWDEEHPTEFGHAFFAILVEGAVVNH